MAGWGPPGRPLLVALEATVRDAVGSLLPDVERERMRAAAERERMRGEPRAVEDFVWTLEVRGPGGGLWRGEGPMLYDAFSGLIHSLHTTTLNAVDTGGD